MKAIEAGLLTLGSSYSPTPSQRLTRSWLTPVGFGPRLQWRAREGFAPSSQQLHLYRVVIANLATRLSCGTRDVKHIDRLIQSPRDVWRCAPDAIPTGHPATYPDIASYAPSAGEPPTWRMILITSFTLRMNTLAAIRANDASDADRVPGNPRQRVPRSRLLGHEKGSSSQASLMLSASVPEHMGHTARGEEPRTRGTARI